ncbi:molybdenum ABC transporter ATP-binding protein [Parvibaculum sp.]|uniref:molybdenum ABC transporter ATP-binding protein n=1 Tax=Parvibaculum sp. TaxID=2024848 RepID=UPI00320D190C
MSDMRLKVAIAQCVEGFALDVAFEAGSGVTGIIGPSGAGKSMTLGAIAGLSRPQSGRIVLGENVFVDTAQGTFIPPERRRVGYVFQEARLFPHLSVAENLDYGARRRGTASGMSRMEVIDLLGIAPLLDRRPHRLSGGEAQRVAIGRALLAAPQLLLMDEPLSSLDIRRRREIMPFIEALHRRLDLPTLFVSHNIDEIVRLADRVVVLHGGHVAASGGVAEVLNRLDVQSLILGEDGGAADPATIIEARVARRDEAYHLTELDIGGATLTVAELPLETGAPVRLRLHARDVALATERPSGLSIQNVIEAQIASIRPAGTSQLDVELSVGTNLRLYARITHRAAARLQLTPGRPVWALVKSVALASDTNESAHSL